MSEMIIDMGINEIYQELDSLTLKVISDIARIAILREELEKRNGRERI